MNQEQAKWIQWLPIIKGLAEGKTIQRLRVYWNNKEWAKEWNDSILSKIDFDVEDPQGYRIKPEPKKEWVRVGKWDAGTVSIRCYARTEIEEQQLQNRQYFGGWLTDRIEYELPEGEA
jgi:hypothetical protein